MPSKDNNVNFKKKHIGNDSTIIVYNESNEEYQFSFIKSEVNCVCVEIEPLKCDINLIRVKATPEMSNQWIGHSESKIISDTYLPMLVRKMALHADFATKVYRAQKDGKDTYGGNWWERLKQINRIKKLCKEKQNNKDTSLNTTANTTSFNLNAINVNNSVANHDYHTDFTENI